MAAETEQSLTKKLREAHIKTLKSRYNALISEAKTELARVEEDYKSGAKAAYVDTEIKRRDLPAQLAAMGFTGGINDTLAAALTAAYSSELERLATERSRKRQDGLFEISRQTAARDNAVNEYRLRNSLSDARAKKKPVVAEEPPAVEDTQKKQFLGDTNLTLEDLFNIYYDDE